MKLRIIFLLFAAVTNTRGDLLDGLEHDHDHHDHEEHHHDHLEEIIDDHDLRSPVQDDDVTFSEDDYEEHLLNEISRFLPKEEFSVSTNDDDRSSEVSLFTHLTNPGRPKSFSVQEPIQQPLLVKQSLPEFGVALEIQPPVIRQPQLEVKEEIKELGIPLQQVQPPIQPEQNQSPPQLGIPLQTVQSLPRNDAEIPLTAVQSFGIVPEEGLDYDSKEIFGTSIEDLTNFLPHLDEEVVVVPSLPVSRTVSNTPEVQKVVIQTPVTNGFSLPSPPQATKRIVSSPPAVKSPALKTPTLVKEVVPVNARTVNDPAIQVAEVTDPALDSLSSPSLSLDPSHSDFDDFSDNSIGGQGRQLDAPRNQGVPQSSRSFNPFEGDYPTYGPYPPAPLQFRCEDQNTFGYFADPEYNCQVFHVCYEEKLLASFLCPNGTLFNQQVFVCDWWFNVECEEAQSYYFLNENIGKVPEDRVRFKVDYDD